MPENPYLSPAEDDTGSPTEPSDQQPPLWNRIASLLVVSTLLLIPATAILVPAKAALMLLLIWPVAAVVTMFLLIWLDVRRKRNRDRSF